MPQYASTDPNFGLGDSKYASTDPNFGADQQAGQPEAALSPETYGLDISSQLAAQPDWSKAVLETLAEKMRGLVPTSLPQAAEMAGQFVVPITRQDIETGKGLYNVARGQPLEQEFPPGKPFTEFGPEDWGGCGADVGFTALMAAQLVPGLARPGFARTEPAIAVEPRPEPLVAQETPFPEAMQAM